MVTFQINQTYACRSVGDYNAVWKFTIAARTAKTITTACGKTLRINARLTAYDGIEKVFPLGRYSFAPILSADKIAA